MNGVGYVPRNPVDPLSVSLDASYHKKQEYIWFMGGDLNGFLYKAFCEVVGHAPGRPLLDSRSMTLDVSYHKDEEYIWYRGGDLIRF